MTVFISDLESAMLHWIIPIGGVFFILLGVLAGVAAVLSMSSIQVDVKIKSRYSRLNTCPSRARLSAGSLQSSWLKEK
jgi:hypothetical protein